MAGSLNKATLIGHLGKDPEMRYMPSGEAIANFSIATSESWTDKASGDKKEKTEWHRCTAWGKLAEVFGQYIKKGSKVYVEGKIETRKWTDKENVERFTTEIRVDRMIMLDRKGEGGDGASSTSTSRPAQASKPAATSGFDDMDDDIPFN